MSASNELKEALECAEYALSHPASNQQFALSAVRAALLVATADYAVDYNPTWTDEEVARTFLPRFSGYLLEEVTQGDVVEAARLAMQALGVRQVGGPQKWDHPATAGELRGDAEVLARDVIDRYGSYAVSVGDPDETHEDCLIRAALRIMGAPRAP